MDGAERKFLGGRRGEGGRPLAVWGRLVAAVIFLGIVWYGGGLHLWLIVLVAGITVLGVVGDLWSRQSRRWPPEDH